jgi:hypothetical protein
MQIYSNPVLPLPYGFSTRGAFFKHRNSFKTTGYQYNTKTMGYQPTARQLYYAARGNICKLCKKGKAIPLQAWTGPECSRQLRLPDFKTFGT